MKHFILPFVIVVTLLLCNLLSQSRGSKDWFDIGSAAFAQQTVNAVNVANAFYDSGNSFIVFQDFGIPPDTGQATLSTLRIFEDGRELGPAHSWHSDIRGLGIGRFSHWGGTDGTSPSALYFSASDNSDPRRNGRTYTYRIDLQPAPVKAPPPTPAPITAPPSGAFYVSPEGSDSNPGTQAQPWRTLVYAASAAPAGATVVVTDGTYEEGEVSWQQNDITIMAEHKWQAVVNSISGCHPAFSAYASHVTIVDLRFSVSVNNPTCGSTTGANGTIRGWNTNDPQPGNPSSGYVGLTVRGVLVDSTNMVRYGGIKSNQDFTLVENSEIHTQLEMFDNDSSILRNNSVYDGTPNGVYVLAKGGCRNTMIYNNVVHLTQAGANLTGGYIDHGIMLGGAGGVYWDAANGYDCYNCVALNNVVINETNIPNASLLGFQGAQNSLIMNNVGIGGQIFMRQDNGGSNGHPITNNATFINNILMSDWKTTDATNGFAGWTGTGTTTVDYNLFYGYSNGLPWQAHAISGDPLFVDPASDWHLQGGSPALEGGTVVTMPAYLEGILDVSMSKDAAPRTAPWSLGVY